MTAPQHIGTAEPFRLTAKEYLAKGWAPIPLPYKKKAKPPVGWTGRGSKFADIDQINEWIEDPTWHKGNIGVHAGNQITIDDTAFEAVGIDVDHYSNKKGGDDLAELEKKLGPLPDTWISGARTDGVSGIRWFLLPSGYEVRGKLSDSIEMVQSVHRYGVVFPSYHPELKTQYRWYGPGDRPDGKHVSLDIPHMRWITHIPDSWFEWLTRNKMLRAADLPVDMSSTREEIWQWVKANFVDLDSVPCRQMKASYLVQKKKVEDSASHHDPLVNAHWRLIRLGAEGHGGWWKAVRAIENLWLQKVEEDNVRTAFEAKAEILRSREGTFRKIRGEVEGDRWQQD